MTQQLHGEALRDFVLDKIDDMKARDVVVLDVHDKSDMTDTMVICTGTSRRHVISIASHAATEAKNAGHQPIGIEGEESGEWVLVDFDELVLHVFQEETRDFYQLEKLWAN